MSTFNWRDYVRELTPQERFATACFGGSQNNFVYARDYLIEHPDLDITCVVEDALFHPDFLKKLLEYYHKNVVDKLQTVKEREEAMDKLKEALEAGILKNGWEKLSEDSQRVIDAEFPDDDDRKMEDFYDQELLSDGNDETGLLASAGTSEDEDEGVHHGDLLGGASGNGFSYGDWEALLAAH